MSDITRFSGGLGRYRLSRINKKNRRKWRHLPDEYFRPFPPSPMKRPGTRPNTITVTENKADNAEHGSGQVAVVDVDHDTGTQVSVN